MNLPKRNLGIFMGNPRVSIEPSSSDHDDLTNIKGFLNGKPVDLFELDADDLSRVRYSFNSYSEIYLDKHQLAAFERAVEFARAYRNQRIRMVVGFDHPGKFGHQYLDPESKFYAVPNLSGKKITLADMHPAIRGPYQEIADRFKVSLESVRVYSEGIARANAKNIAEKLPTGNSLRESMYRRQKNCSRDRECVKVDSGRPAVTCEAVVAMYLYATAKYGAEEVHAFWCDSDHTRRVVVDGGTRIFNDLGETFVAFNITSGVILNNYHFEDTPVALSSLARITGVSYNARRVPIRRVLGDQMSA